ncbi:MAG: ribosome assembly RNA-binding protein YhbY [Myxococcales bacterium]|nr:ribosome assembly RNA-binding protein YhbY [Myxococcales bacterium]
MAPPPRPAPPLSGNQSRHLRALAHSTKPVVQVGKNGWSAGLRAEIDAALLAHELIKVRITGEAPLDSGALAVHIAAENGAAVVQTVGHTLTVYRRHPNKPKIELPKRRQGARP